MEVSIDHWHDWWRLILVLTCLITAYVLVVRFRRSADEWNTKTRDYWFALWTWNLAGLVGAAEGIFQDLELGSRLVFITAASIVSLIGLTRRGSWGGTDD